ncbi:MAG: hypothetical protein ACHQ1D_10620 [Nitrososphaerales archaeon]
MKKIYNILLDEKIIGTTRLEYANPPMGVVFGQAHFVDIDSAYEFFKNYCNKNNIGFKDYPEDKLFQTRTIPNLKVIDETGIEIKGQGNQISGMDSDVYELTIEGIPYPFFGEQFPHHVKDYEERFQ